MGYVMESKRKLYLLFGFTGMFLCGIGDILFAFRGEGEPYAIGGMISMHIDQVPLWYYKLSFFIGIVAMIGYWLGSRAMFSYITDQLNGRKSRLTVIYSIGANMMSLGIFGIHSVCSVVIMCLRAAVCSGLSAESINEYFMGTVLFPFVVTTIWQTLADLLVAIGYIGFICKKVINISKAWIVCGPICLYLIFGIVRTILEQFTANPLYGKLLAGGETWGLAFMFLAVFFRVKRYNELVETDCKGK